jgi:soluble lytic murein transglycosylase-like protein
MALYPGSPLNSPLYRAKNTYREENQSTFNALARRTNFSGGAQQLTGYYEIQAHGAVTLASAGYNGLIAAVGEWIDGQLP